MTKHSENDADLHSKWLAELVNAHGDLAVAGWGNGEPDGYWSEEAFSARYKMYGGVPPAPEHYRPAFQRQAEEYERRTRRAAGKAARVILLRQERNAAGLCVRCGGPRSGQFGQCLDCRVARRVRRKELSNAS